MTNNKLPPPSAPSPGPAPSNAGDGSSPGIDPHRDIARYAYIAESAVWDFHNARVFCDEHYPDARQVCELYASSARQALQALLIAARRGSVMASGYCDSLECEWMPGRVGTNLVRALQELRATDPSLPPALAKGEMAMSSARRLARALHAAQRPTGPDYLLRDYYDRVAVIESHEAAEVLVDGMVRRLLDLSLSQLERRYHRQLKPPMLDTRLWRERDPLRRSSGRARDLSAASEAAATSPIETCVTPGSESLLDPPPKHRRK